MKYRRLGLIWLLLHLSFGVYAQSDTILVNTVQCSPDDWILVFSEDFDGHELNTNQWVTWFPYTEDGSDQCSFCRTHANGGQIYRDSNVMVNNGTLKLIARPEVNTWFGVEREYTSGMIHSRKSFGMGKFEIRCQLPSGMGFWPAIWLYGNTTSELDILEAGMQNPKRYHTSIHNRHLKRMLHRRHKLAVNLAEGFHIYTMEWDTNFIRFQIDDKIMWQVSRFLNKNGRRHQTCPVEPGMYRLEPVFPPEDEKVQLIINLCIGNATTAFTKSPDKNTILPNQMEVDWIKIYKRK
ncbi:MAG: glycoside hydrolase family 16 protein [Lentimicrobiaceae bacterium]|nr:glycoside hydrolase family 16 protein [Lentimicrobiaceae bacterium]MCO5266789.1 glycoside hydrolase family 16 protein [Lentimicrobium sp.]HPG34200.1 glycoside hydrolase family 16 protein [Lentimicrobium sp.]